MSISLFERETAVYEVRPWLNAVVSLGTFQTTRELSIVDCARKASLTELGWMMRCLECNENEKPTPEDEELEEIVWGEINNALSQPVQKSDEPVNYIPTQILCELFKVNGADGIAYKSSVRKGGHNLALFDLKDADIRSCGLYRIEEITYCIEQDGNPWVKR